MNLIIFESIDSSDPKINKTGKKAVFRSLYHFYVISGMIETKISSDLGVPITCNIEKFHISDKIKESYVDLSIEFK